jgi:hypothetical protein
MIAKLIVHGATREIALRQMDRALATTEVAGATTNLAFLRRLVGHGRFASGDVDTGPDRGRSGGACCAADCVARGRGAGSDGGDGARWATAPLAWVQPVGAVAAERDV